MTATPPYAGIKRLLDAGFYNYLIPFVEADARRYLEWGADFIAVGSDLGLFRTATQALRDKFPPAG
jgi:2-keto-3-deoxy-L-rhamnonate aldolase RhmA